MSLVERLKAKRGFTPTEQAIADYVLHHAEEVPYMPVGDLADEAHVSKAAVIRLCQKLGLDGYRELRIGLASELERRRGHLSNVDADQPFTPKESCATIIRLVAELEREAIAGCYQSIVPDVIDEAARAIVNARRVVIYSVGDSCLVTSLFASKLTKLGVSCVNAGLYGDLNAHTALLGPRDVAIVVSYSGLLLRGIMRESGIASIASRGCKTIAITGLDEDDELVRDADTVISFPLRESQTGAIGPFYSTTCMSFILNCIYARVYSYDFDRFGESKAEVDAMGQKAIS